MEERKAVLELVDVLEEAAEKARSVRELQDSIRKPSLWETSPK